ncbi:hypothetical protein [Lewinella sp. W8]|uniref:hypothetical protein n=1 Tax=Lewinella sp. W8 TaxID=2528208 RepID=UPI001067403F|nr:hypothetical protein [Lewinella sp. W8]MTB49808.1 hypothetical protein [Lewinella sp. W8]
MPKKHKITGIADTYQGRRIDKSETWIKDRLQGKNKPPFIATETGQMGTNGHPIVKFPDGSTSNLIYYTYQTL